MATPPEVDNLWSETMAGENTRISVVREEKILQILPSLECVVLSSSLYMLATAIIFFNLPEYIVAFKNTHLDALHVGEYTATNHLDFSK